MAALIDLGVLLFALLLFTAAFGETDTEGGSVSMELSGLPFLIYSLLAFLYYFVPEALRGRTPGKRIMGLRVVTLSGEPYSRERAFLRNILRFIDGLPVFYLVALVLIAVTRKHQRLGDMLAGTQVVRA